MCNKKSGDLECSRRPIDGVSKKWRFICLDYRKLLYGKLKLEKIINY